jgi:hypothetical protein
VPAPDAADGEGEGGVLGEGETYHEVAVNELDEEVADDRGV